MKKQGKPKPRPKSKAAESPRDSDDDRIRFTCPCGAALKIPAWRLDGHGVCPRCKRRLLLAGKSDEKGQGFVRPLILEGEKTGQTFVIEDQFRIEDHFKEIPEAQDKIAFYCPCGFKIHARLNLVDKRGKCPQCGARLLLVGKMNPRTQHLEIHPLVVDEERSGDTQVVDE